MLDDSIMISIAVALIIAIGIITAFKVFKKEKKSITDPKQLTTEEIKIAQEQIKISQQALRDKYSNYKSKNG